jgi:hypothetical protein
MRALVSFTDTPDLADDRPLARAGRVIWERLPALLMLDIAVLLAAAPVAMLALGGAPLAAIAIATLVTGPIWAGVVATVDRMVADEAVSILAYPGIVRSHAPSGVAISAVPAAVAAMLLGGVMAPESWSAMPLLAGCSLAVIVLAASTAAYSLGTTGGLRGWPLWRAAIAVAAASPVATCGLIGLAVVLALLATQLGLVVLMVAPAPFAVVCSALTWATVERHRPA